MASLDRLIIFGRELQRRRKQARITQTDFGHLLQQRLGETRSSSYISKWERAEKPETAREATTPSDSDLEIIAEVLSWDLLEIQVMLGRIPNGECLLLLNRIQKAGFCLMPEWRQIEIIETAVGSVNRWKEFNNQAEG